MWFVINVALKSKLTNKKSYAKGNYFPSRKYLPINGRLISSV